MPFLRPLFSGLLALSLGYVAAAPADAAVIRGTGAAALRGGDLTDPENDGAPDADTNYNATFAASEEPNFGGGEGAFNVFDNQTGGGNAKFCCGDQNNFPTNPITIDATFGTAQLLRSFTITSGNDTAERDPRVFQIQGSNDGMNFTQIFTRNDAATTPFTARDQVLEFVEGVDYPVQTTPYSTIRFSVTASGLTTGARFQLAELEYFNTVPEPTTLSLFAIGALSVSLRRRRRA